MQLVERAHLDVKDPTSNESLDDENAGLLLNGLVMKEAFAHRDVGDPERDLRASRAEGEKRRRIERERWKVASSWEESRVKQGGRKKGSEWGRGGEEGGKVGQLSLSFLPSLASTRLQLDERLT